MGVELVGQVTVYYSSKSIHLVIEMEADDGEARMMEVMHPQEDEDSEVVGEIGNEDHEKVKTDVKKPLSAYNYFYKYNVGSVKEELVKEGKDCSIGNLTQLVSNKWQALDEPGKKKYESMAEDDKLRYDRQCIARDEEILRLQDERRKSHALNPTDTRMRSTTILATSKAEEPKRKRELTEGQIEDRDQRKQVRMYPFFFCVIM